MQTMIEQNSVFDNCGEQFSSGVKCRLYGLVLSTPSMNKGKYTFIVRADSLIAFQGMSGFNHKNILCFSSIEPPAYGTVELIGTFRPPRPREYSENGFNEYLYYMSNNLWGVFYGESAAREALSGSFPARCATAVRSLTMKALSRVKNEDYRGILTASFLNEKNDLSDEMKALFFNAGIYHLLALSGFNIAVLAGMMYALLFLFPVKKEIKILLVIAMIWLYLLFIGFIPSLFRAVIMTTVVGLSFIFQKKNYPLNALGIAGIAWLVMSPQSLFTPSYQLSFAATFGIIALSPVFNDYFKFSLRNAVMQKVVRFFLLMASVSLSSFITTAPILIYHFNQLYLFGLFANLFAVSLMAMAMWVACVGFIFELFLPPLAALCMFFAESIIHIMIRCAGLVTFVPWSNIKCSLPYPEAYLILSLSLLGFILIKKELRLRYTALVFPAGMILVLVCVVMHSTGNEAKVACFEMKNSSVVAIKWPNNSIWIIDAGAEMPDASIYRNHIGPWISKFTGERMEKVILTRRKHDAVHFLCPVFENEKNANVIFCDSAYAQDKDLLAFIDSYKRSVAFKLPGEPITAISGCTCRVVSTPGGKKKTRSSIIVRVHHSVVFFPDSPTAGTVKNSYRQQIITIGGNKWKSIEH